jgi:hypothetical protein
MGLHSKKTSKSWLSIWSLQLCWKGPKRIIDFILRNPWFSFSADRFFLTTTKVKKTIYSYLNFIFFFLYLSDCVAHSANLECDPRDTWMNKIYYYLVKMSHAEYAEFAEAHTLCLCLPSGWWRKCSVRLRVFPHVIALLFRMASAISAYSAWKKISPADHEDLRVSFIKCRYYSKKLVIRVIRGDIWQTAWAHSVSKNSQILKF